MSVHKEDNNSRPFKPQIYPKKRSGQSRQNFDDKTEIDYSVETDKDKT